MGPPGRCGREFGMKWRVRLELVGPDGIVGVHEVCGRAAVAEYAPQMIGLTLEEGKHLLAALQVHLIQAQAGGSLPPPATLPALRRTATPQRSALPAIGVAVRHGGGPRAALHTPVSVRGDLPPDAQPGCRDHARPMHTGCTSGPSQGWVRCYPIGGHRRCWWSFCPSANRRPWNHPATNPSCWHEAGAGGCRGDGIQVGGGDELDCTLH